MADIQKWKIKGDWFDVCRCAVPCPCSWAQPPDDDLCEGILLWHIKQGSYGTVRLEQPTDGEAATIILPHEELVKISKACGKNDTLLVQSAGKSSETSGVISYPVSGQLVEARLEQQRRRQPSNHPQRAAIVLCRGDPGKRTTVPPHLPGRASRRIGNVHEDVRLHPVG